jgi:hypothetical protein
MPFTRHGSHDDFHLFHREKRLLRGTLVMLATLFTLAFLAFTTPRAEAALTWAGELLSSLAA